MRAFAIFVIVSAMIFSIIDNNNTYGKKVVKKKEKEVALWKEISPIQIAKNADGSLSSKIDDDIILPIKKVKVHAQYARDLYQVHKKFIRRSKTKFVDNIDNVIIPEASDELLDEEKNIIEVFRGMNDVYQDIDLIKKKEFIEKINEDYIKKGRLLSNGRSIYSYALSKYWNNHYMESPSTMHFGYNYDLNEYLYDGTTLVMNKMVGSSANVKRLLFEGSNVNMRSRDGGATALHFAALNSMKYSKGRRFNSEIYNNFTFLIAYGANINAQTNDEWSIYEGFDNGKIIKNIIGNKGLTPLMIIERDNGIFSKMLAELLIENGADVNLEDSKGNTAINYISLPTDISGSLLLVQEKVEYLVSHGADPMHKGSEGKTIFDRIEEAPARNAYINADVNKRKLKDNQKNIGLPYDKWVEKMKEIYRGNNESLI